MSKTNGHGPARPVLVASDGSKVSGSAIRLARAMADAGVWAPTLVTVLEPLPVAVADVVLAAPVPAYVDDVTESRLGLIRNHAKRAGGSRFPIRSEHGGTAASITRSARTLAAELVVLGLGEHGNIARLFGAETAVRVMRHSSVPLLAVALGSESRPFTAVAGMDFSKPSIRAAKEALRLIQPPGRLHLVHVRPRFNLMAPTPGTAWDDMYEAALEHGFRRVIAELGRWPGITMSHEVVSGGVVDALLKAATRRRADLIAVGSHGQGAIDRLLVGSTPSHLLRTARCSVLVAPPA